MLSPDIILLIMLALQPAGRSPFSHTVVEPDSPPPCDNVHSPLCAPPRANKHWDGQYTRVETEEEGRARYAMIASVIFEVSREMTWHKHPRCQPASVSRWSTKKAPDVCKQAWKARPWQGSSDQLARYLIAIAFKESGFRRDVHAGKGKASKGDPDSHGKGQSWGLFQRKLGASGNGKTRRGWRAVELVGLDRQSTRRSVVTAVDVLSHGYNACRGGLLSEKRGPACVFGIYGGLWAVSGNPAIAARVRLLGRIERLQQRFVAEQKAAPGGNSKAVADRR